MDLTRIAVRALVAYIYLLLVVRAGGKRLIGEATAFDFILSLIIGDLVDDVLWADVSMTRFAGAVGSIFALDIIVEMIAARSRTFFRLVNGAPAIVLRDGVEDRKVLRREQLNNAELAHMLRAGGIEDWTRVRLAIVDRGHDLSILRYWWSTPVQRKDRQAVK